MFYVVYTLVRVLMQVVEQAAHNCVCYGNIHVCMYVCMYVYVCVYIHTYVYINIYVCICIHIYTHNCVCYGKSYVSLLCVCMSKRQHMQS